MAARTSLGEFIPLASRRPIRWSIISAGGGVASGMEELADGAAVVDRRTSRQTKTSQQTVRSRDGVSLNAPEYCLETC